MDKRTARAQRTSAEAVRRDALGVMAALRAASTATDRLAVAGVADTDDLVAEAVAAILSGVATTYGEALGVAVAALRDSRSGSADSSEESRGVSVYLSATDGDTDDGDTIGDTLADDTTAWVGRDLSRRFADGARFAIVYADGWDTDGATYTSADGATMSGAAAIAAARTAALHEATAGEHGAAAAARGAVAQAKSADRDEAVAEALRVVGQGRGYAEAVAQHMGWITPDSTPAQRLAAMNRARVAVSRLGKRTDGDNSHSARD